MKYRIIAGKFRRDGAEGPITLKKGDEIEFTPEQAADHILCGRLVPLDGLPVPPRKHRQGKPVDAPVEEDEPGTQAPTAAEHTEPTDIPLDELPTTVSAAVAVADEAARESSKVVRVRGRG